MVLLAVTSPPPSQSCGTIEGSGHQKRHMEETSSTSESHTTPPAEETGKDAGDEPVMRGEV